MCGENGSGRSRWLSRVGSSPHVRGKPLLLTSALAPRRLIPARAGKTTRPTAPDSSATAHPRACGENRLGASCAWGHLGSSPRVRGKHDLITTQKLLGHLIPARAGKTSVCGRTCPPNRPHPRACGENPILALTLKWGCGSSPRVRGKPGDFVAGRGWHGLIPARAGKTRPSATLSPRSPAHPRVCGENAGIWRPAQQALGSSPRVRGKPVTLCIDLDGQRLIPACAGKTIDILSFSEKMWAHPRVCGEN